MKHFLSLLALVASFSSAIASDLTWGYYGGNKFSDLSGVGVQAAASYTAGMYVEDIAALNGASIVSVNLPIASKTNMDNVEVWIADAQKNKLVSQKVKTTSLTSSAFNTIILDEPCTVNGAFYAGYSFSVLKATTQADQYPIMFYSMSSERNTLLLAFQDDLGSVPAISKMDDYSSQFGALGMTLNFTGVNLNDYSASFESIDNGYTIPGKEFSFKVGVNSNGEKAVTSIDYDIEIAGQKESRSANLNIAGGLGKHATLNVAIVGPAEIGDYEVKMNITKINGQENSEAANVAVSTFHNVARLAKRCTVVEEFTGTSCPWCPRGIAGMNLLRDTYPDTFIGIAIHQYSSADPMYNSNYANLGFQGAPSCAIDRRGSDFDPYYGSVNSILDDYDRLNAEVAPVEIGLTGVWTDDTKKSVELEATTTAIAAGSYKIAFVLVADSLRGSSTSWRQANNYASYASSGDAYLDPFCKGGAYGTSYFYYAFDDVLIGSSYSGTTNKAPALGQLAVDEAKTVSYTVPITMKTAQRAVLDASIDKVYGIAIVLNSNGTVANAIKIHIENVKDSSSAIEEVQTEAPSGKAYDLEGREMRVSQKGLQIERGKVMLIK